MSTYDLIKEVSSLIEKQFATSEQYISEANEAITKLDNSVRYLRCYDSSTNLLKKEFLLDYDISIFELKNWLKCSFKQLIDGAVYIGKSKKGLLSIVTKDESVGQLADLGDWYIESEKL